MLDFKRFSFPMTVPAMRKSAEPGYFPGAVLRRRRTLCRNDFKQHHPADDDPDQVDMAEVEKLIPENIPHKVLLEMGEPVPMLLYLAGEIGADLIITGSRGRGTLKSLFMGSVSSGILKNAKCPVFIIK